MTDIGQAKNIIDELKNPRAFLRGKAVDALMAIDDESVIPGMFGVVKHETDFVKIHFCKFLGKIGGTSAVPPLVLLILDNSEKVAHEASLALDNIDNDRKTEALLMLLNKGNHFSKRYAIKSLGGTGKIKAIPALVKLLSCEERDIKALAVEALRQIGDASVINPLSKLLRDKDDRVIHLVLYALGEVGDRRAGASIAKFLGHESPDIRKMAVWALSKMEYKKAVPELIRMLKDDSDETVREEIAKRLGALDAAKAVLPLITTKAFDGSHNVKVYADWALADISAEDKKKEFLRIIKEQDEHIRGEAYLGIAKIGDESDYALLEDAFSHDGSELVRSRLAEGFAFVKTPGIKSLLETALSDAETVSRKAADSLVHTASADDKELALKMAKGEPAEDSYVREAGMKIIERICPEGAPGNMLDILYGLVKEEPLEVRSAAVKCLGKVGDRSTVQVLKDLLPGETDTLQRANIENAITLLERKRYN